MSADRLGRCLVMAIGEIVDEKGDLHQVVFADGEACQAPINTKAALLSLVVKPDLNFCAAELHSRDSI